MFCPKCGEEFSWDVMVCPKCDVDTVDRWVREEDADRARELLSGLAS
jgi:hypothetical protein